jgi:hypothetical protein
MGAPVKRGRKVRPDASKILRGTFKPGRAVARVVDALPGVPVKPAWLRGAGAAIWAVKVATYSRRGQSVTGCEGPLATYCAIEADIVGRWQRREDIPVALLTGYRLYAECFYDTPASQHAARSTTGGANPFTSHGRPPGATGGR